MPQEFVSHTRCDHPDTKYGRWKCRAQKRHAGCDHKQNPTDWRFCEDTARREVKES